MGITIKNLYNGQLPNSKGSLYTAGASAIIKSIVLVNTNTTTESVNLYYLQASGTSRRLIPQALQLPAGNALIFEITISMAVNDIIQGDTTTANKVDCTISGMESS